MSKTNLAKAWETITVLFMEKPSSGMSLAKKVLLAGFIMASCIVLDQATKKIAENTLKYQDPISFAGDTFRLQYAENRGAFLSLGKNLPDPARFIIFTLGVCIILGGLFVYLFFSKTLDLPSFISLSCILSGGVSNLVDRIIKDGYVVDFMNMGLGPLRTGIFNVADLFITFGAIALVLLQYLLGKKLKKTASEAAQINSEA